MFIEVTTPESVALFLGSAIAAAVNAVVGGGSLMTLPILLYLNVPLKAAIAVNLTALTCGGITSVFGGSRSLTENPDCNFLFVIPAILGAFVGSELLVHVPSSELKLIAQVLIGVSSLTFLFPGLGTRVKSMFKPLSPASIASMFAVSMYGGFFGAGMGVLISSVLLLFTKQSVHAVNALKNFLQTIISLMSAIVFSFSGLLSFNLMMAMVPGAAIGGWATGFIIQAIPQKYMRWFMFSLSIMLACVLTFDG